MAEGRKYDVEAPDRPALDYPEGRGPQPRRSLAGWVEASTTALNSAGSAWVCVLMLVICADIASRGLFNVPLPGVAEVVALSIVALVFLQLPHTLTIGSLTRVELFLDHFRRTRPRAAWLVLLLSHLLGAITFALILYGSFPAFLGSWRQGEFVGIQGTFTAPTWPSKAAVVVGCVLMCVQFLIYAANDIRRLLRDDDPGGAGAGK